MQPLSNLLCYSFPQGISLQHETADLNSKPIYFVALTLKSVGFYTFSPFFLSGFKLDTGSLGLYTSS